MHLSLTHLLPVAVLGTRLTAATTFVAAGQGLGTLFIRIFGDLPLYNPAKGAITNHIVKIAFC